MTLDSLSLRLNDEQQTVYDEVSLTQLSTWNINASKLAYINYLEKSGFLSESAKLHYFPEIHDKLDSNAKISVKGKSVFSVFPFCLENFIKSQKLRTPQVVLGAISNPAMKVLLNFTETVSETLYLQISFLQTSVCSIFSDAKNQAVTIEPYEMFK